MQVTENILDPQYRKRKSPTQRHHAYVEDRLPAAYAAQGHRAMLAPTVGSTATRRSKGARNILWSAFFLFARLRCGNLCVWHSVPERATYGTEYACRAQKGFLGYATHFRKHSVLRTGFYGTEEIFCAKNSLLWYATNIQRPAEQPTPQTVDSLLPHRTHLQCAKRPPLGCEQT